MKTLKSIFFSMTSAIVLLIIFAVASGLATIIESIYDTKSAWAVIYGSAWFAAVQLFLGMNLAYNIFRYNLIRLEKLPALIFHVSFLFILIGSAITRYVGFEGTISIREGQSSNMVFETGSSISLIAYKNETIYEKSLQKRITMIGSNEFDLGLDVDKQEARLKFVGYYKNAVIQPYEADTGDPLVQLVVSDATGKYDIELKRGESKEINDISFAFNAEPLLEKFVKIEFKDDNFTMTSSGKIETFKMLTGEKSEFISGSEFEPMQLYSIGDTNFAPKHIIKKANKKIVSKDGEFDALVTNLSFNGASKDVILYENQGPVIKNIGGMDFAVAWGSRPIVLPFSIKLVDFELKRYPGSYSPMSYSSDVIIQDTQNGEYPYKIYMNHVLDHAGYRFFQSSYDPDELGTVLSVNRDPGKIPTYIGYFLLGLGLLLNIINPHSRFRKLAKMINQDTIKKVASVAIIGFFAIFSQNLNAENFAKISKISQEHAAKLATLIIQSQDGRMKPFDTVARDVLNKIYKNDTFKGFNANQIVLSMMIDAPIWRKIPIIYVNNKELKKIIGIKENEKYACFDDFFELNSQNQNQYKIAKYAEVANRKRPAERGTFDKDVQKVDERLNVLYMVFLGEIFAMFPDKDDANHKWYAPGSAMMNFKQDDATAVSKMLSEYFAGVADAQKNGDWAGADAGLAQIKTYQDEYGKAIIPNDMRVKMELFFNKYKIFESLTPIYLIAGFGLLMFVFAKIIRPKMSIKWLFGVVYGVNILAFTLHTFGIAIRWYIAQHAPWSNAYESMIYIAWALSLSGIVFSRQSPIAMALTSILAGVTLFVAHLSWMDPQITTLVPVLQSYWLTIHVSVITASYGFLGLCALLGFFTLLLFIAQGEKENHEISRNILEATRINEMAMILGLSLLTLGNFLGGVWANESWGRYWGWDSKETWALVSILVYSAVLHIRFVPKLNSQYVFATLSMFAYWSIIMTYFGVNFYLSGMHSYAAGDPIPVPYFVRVSMVVMVVIAIGAYFRKPQESAKL
ncbi:MAG: cytochrome c biogenesis protein CcsA [Campylobacter sp.]